MWCRVRFEPRHFLTISGVRNFTQDFFLCDETKKRGARLALLWLQGVCCFSRSGCQSPFFHTAPSIGGLFQTSFQTPPRSAYLTSLQKWNHFPFEKSHFLDWFSIIWRSRSCRIVRRTVWQVLQPNEVFRFGIYQVCNTIKCCQDVFLQYQKQIKEFQTKPDNLAFLCVVRYLINVIKKK